MKQLLLQTTYSYQGRSVTLTGHTIESMRSKATRLLGTEVPVLSELSVSRRRAPWYARIIALLW
jgi:hypothetical protein